MGEVDVDAGKCTCTGRCGGLNTGSAESPARLDFGGDVALRVRRRDVARRWALTSQGYQSGDSDISAQVALRAGIPAVLVLIAPTIPAIGFGLRARQLGIPAGSHSSTGRARRCCNIRPSQRSSAGSGLVGRHVLRHLRDSRGCACRDRPGDQLRISASAGSPVQARAIKRLDLA